MCVCVCVCVCVSELTGKQKRETGQSEKESVRMCVASKQEKQTDRQTHTPSIQPRYCVLDENCSGCLSTGQDKPRDYLWEFSHL